MTRNNTATLRIMRKGRGVYLGWASEDFNGTESWDAFPTLKAAKSGLAAMVGRKRLRWAPAGRSYWSAVVAVPEDWTC